MPTGYFAKVVDGVVEAVIRAEPEYVAGNPDLFLGNWVEVLEADHYPAIGWAWTDADRFIEPPPSPDLTAE